MYIYIYMYMYVYDEKRRVNPGSVCRVIVWCMFVCCSNSHPSYMLHCCRVNPHVDEHAAQGKQPPEVNPRIRVTQYTYVYICVCIDIYIHIYIYKYMQLLVYIYVRALA